MLNYLDFSVWFSKFLSLTQTCYQLSKPLVGTFKPFKYCVIFISQKWPLFRVFWLLTWPVGSPCLLHSCYPGICFHSVPRNSFYLSALLIIHCFMYFLYWIHLHFYYKFCLTFSPKSLDRIHRWLTDFTDRCSNHYRFILGPLFKIYSDPGQIRLFMFI